MPPSQRSPLVAWIFAGLVAACGPGPEPKAPGAPSGCEGPKLASCERDLAKAVRGGAAVEPLLSAYLRARGDDAWASLWTKLSDRRGAAALIVDSRPAGTAPAAAGARSVASPALPEPAGISGAELLLAMAGAAGYEHAVWLGAGGGKPSYELFPRDPLGPLSIGLPGVTRDDAAAEHLAEDIRLAATIGRAFEAAGAFRYVDAAKEGAALAAQIEGRDPFSEPVLRARYARTLLSNAGLSLEAPVTLFGDDAPSAKPSKLPAAPAPAEADTPYGDLLRARVAEDPIAEWRRRGPRVLAAVAEDRRAVTEAYFGPPGACGAVTEPPAFDRPSDLTFAALMPQGLAGARVEALADVQSAGLPLTAWYPRYERLVALTDERRLAWLEAPTLLRQRGEVGGISSAGTAAYRRASEIGLSHLRALRDLAESEPDRYAATAELALAYSPGLLGDEPLRDALIALTQSTTKNRLGRAHEPSSIAGSLLVGVFVGLTYPPAIQSAHYLALQSAFAAKVKGELATKTGWGAAALFALDAVFRVIADQGPDLAFSSGQIARALSDPAIAQPGLAALASAAVRYAALAKDRPLSALASAAQQTPERAAAREALRKAIAGMGDKDEAPAQLTEDLTTLADGLIATLTIALHRKEPPPGTCTDKGPASADIEISHALTKLAAVRGKIQKSPKLQGDGLWARRARLLAMILSDAMDFAAPVKKGAPRKLTLAATDVEQALTGALREWDEPGARDAIVGIYSLSRFLLSRDSSATLSSGGPHLVRALGGIGRFLRGGSGSPGATMLDALADVSGKEGGPGDLLGALVAYAKGFYDKGQPDQGDVFLLGTLLLSSTRRTPPPAEAVSLAAAQKSRIEWALQLFAEAAAAEASGRPNVKGFEAGARKAAEAQCALGRVDDIVTVMSAVAQFESGERKEAREALDAVLERADAQGLVVPRMNYQYSEKHDKKVFNLSFGITYGVGFMEGGNAFQIGVGLSSAAERSSKLTVSAASPEETATETARYYVRAAALASAYHFLDGDPARAATDARRAVQAIVSGVRLGARSITAERARWAEDARALLAVDAQLAADAGLPFLAGDLWTVVKDTFAADTDDAAVSAVLASAPFGLVGVKDAEAPIERARRSLRVLAGPLACTAERVETAAYIEPTCAAYPLALALRVADVVKDLPRLKRSADNAQGRCLALRSLDAFLEATQSGSYDPDLFTKAVEDFRASDRLDEAATLLSRHKNPSHCNPSLMATARALGRSPLLLPASRADMLAVAVNCAGTAGGADLQKDLVALDEETRKLADPTRNLKLLFFAADLSTRANRPELLLSLVQAPDYLARYLKMHANAVAAALVLHHAAHALAGEALDTAPSESTFSLVCNAFPSEDRKAQCDDIKAMREGKGALEDRRRAARDALQRLLSPPPAPAGKKP